MSGSTLTVAPLLVVNRHSVDDDGVIGLTSTVGTVSLTSKNRCRFETLAIEDDS